MENSPVAISGQLPRFHIGPSDPYAAFGLIDLDTSYIIHVDVEVLFSLHKVSHGCLLSWRTGIMTKAEFDAALAAIREGKACDNDCQARVENAIADALRLRLGIADDAPTRAQIIEFIDSLDDEGKERLRDVAESLEWILPPNYK
jgi:hypothetical protein